MKEHFKSAYKNWREDHPNEKIVPWRFGSTKDTDMLKYMEDTDKEINPSFASLYASGKSKLTGIGSNADGKGTLDFSNFGKGKGKGDVNVGSPQVNVYVNATQAQVVAKVAADKVEDAIYKRLVDAHHMSGN
jgi:hypothetical protein